MNIRRTMNTVLYFIEKGYSNFQLNHDTNDAVIQKSNWIIWTLFIRSMIVWHDRILNKLNEKCQAKSRCNKYAIHNIHCSQLFTIHIDCKLKHFFPFLSLPFSISFVRSFVLDASLGIIILILLQFHNIIIWKYLSCAHYCRVALYLKANRKPFWHLNWIRPTLFSNFFPPLIPFIFLPLVFGLFSSRYC